MKEDLPIKELQIKFSEEFKGKFQFPGTYLGEGGYNKVFEVIIGKNRLAGKFIKVDKSKSLEEPDFLVHLLSNNIIKVNKIFKQEIEKDSYFLVLMEKATLGNVDRLNKCLQRDHGTFLIRLLFNPFKQVVGNNLLRFFVVQMIKALEVLNRSNYVHFDIKLSNFLVLKNLTIKLCDFNISEDLNKYSDSEKNKKVKKTGGTKGYLTPEYYLLKDMNKDTAIKQDIFGLGVCMYLLMFGENDFFINKGDEKRNVDELIDVINDNINKIQYKIKDNNLKNLLIGLLQSDPKDRLKFEEIFSNIWINKYKNIIADIEENSQSDEEKLIIELQKSDFFEKEEEQQKKNEFLKEEQKDLKINYQNNSHNLIDRDNIMSNGKLLYKIKKKKYIRKNKTKLIK